MGAVGMERMHEVAHAAALRSLWEQALDAQQDSDEPTDAMDEDEQTAYDALVDYLEAHALSGTEFDPRAVGHGGYESTSNEENADV